MNELKKGPGRPRKENALTNAERQKAHRERRKAEREEYMQMILHRDEREFFLECVRDQYEIACDNGDVITKLKMASLGRRLEKGLKV